METKRATAAPPKEKINIGFFQDGCYYLRCGHGEEHTMTIDENDKVTIYDQPIESFAFVWSQISQIYPIYIEA